MKKLTKSKINEIFVGVDRTREKIWGLSAEMLVEMMDPPVMCRRPLRRQVF